MLDSIQMTLRRVLIIDSDASGAEALKRLIAGWNYDVASESDERRVLDTLNKTEPAVIVASSTVNAAQTAAIAGRPRSTAHSPPPPATNSRPVLK